MDRFDEALDDATHAYWVLMAVVLSPLWLPFYIWRLVRDR